MEAQNLRKRPPGLLPLVVWGCPSPPAGPMRKSLIPHSQLGLQSRFRGPLRILVVARQRRPTVRGG